jgi:hypothetical protein
MTSSLGYLLIAMSLGAQFEASKYRSETRPEHEIAYGGGAYYGMVPPL